MHTTEDDRMEEETACDASWAIFLIGGKTWRLEAVIPIWVMGMGTSLPVAMGRIGTGVVSQIADCCQWISLGSKARIHAVS